MSLVANFFWNTVLTLLYMVMGGTRGFPNEPSGSATVYLSLAADWLLLRELCKSLVAPPGVSGWSCHSCHTASCARALKETDYWHRPRSFFVLHRTLEGRSIGSFTLSVWHSPGQLSLLPSARREMSTGQSEMMLCGWGVKAGMVHSTCG